MLVLCVYMWCCVVVCVHVVLGVGVLCDVCTCSCVVLCRVGVLS